MRSGDECLKPALDAMEQVRQMGEKRRQEREARNQAMWAKGGKPTFKPEPPPLVRMRINQRWVIVRSGPEGRAVVRFGLDEKTAERLAGRYRDQMTDGEVGKGLNYTHEIRQPKRRYRKAFSEGA